MSKNGCDLYRPIKAKDIVNCCNCQSWNWDKGKCVDEDRLVDNKTSICHGEVPVSSRFGRVFR